MHTIQCFLAYSEFVCHHYLTSEYFHHIQKSHAYSLAVIPQSAFPLKPWQLCPVSVDLSILGVSYKWITICSFCDQFLSLNIFSRFSHVVACIYTFISFHGWMISHCMYTAYLSIYTYYGHLGCSLCLAVMRSAAMNICVCVFVWIHVFNLFSWEWNWRAIWKVYV